MTFHTSTITGCSVSDGSSFVLNFKRRKKSELKLFNTRNDYTQWAYEEAVRYSEEKKSKLQTSLEYLKKNSFFLTMTFNQKRVKYRKLEMGISSSGSTMVELTTFRMHYIEICKAMLGNGYKRRWGREQQPFCFLFFDVEGSKFKQSFEWEDIKGIHIHALLIFPATHTDWYENWSKSYLTRLQLMPFSEADKIEVEKYNEKKSSLKELLSYSSKFARKNTSSEMGIADIMIFPEHRHYHRPECLQWKKRNYSGENRRKIMKRYYQKGLDQF